MIAPKIWAEVWTRPGHATYGRTIADPPVSVGSVTVGFSGVGGGSLTLPANYSRSSEILDQILYADPTNPANGQWSTIRVFSEQGWLYDWLPSPLTPPQTRDDVGTQVTGAGIEAIMGFYRTEPWDWNGDTIFPSTFPDWIYGGRNLLVNPGFEESTCRPEINQITLDPTVAGGTFTLSDGIDTTSNLAWNASAFTIETELESDIAAIDDVVVEGSGTEADPWVITFISPCEFPGGLIFDGTNLTPDPGTSGLSRIQYGALQPNPWTKSQVVSSGTPRVFGGYDSFRVTTAQARTGTFSLLVDPATIGRRYAGAQQVVSTKIGGRYQASVWVFTATAAQTYRLVIRGIDEDIMLDVNGDPAIVQVTPSVNTWTQLAIPDVIAEDDQLVFRVANINVSGNPAVFYIDDGEFNEGMSAATVGLMMREHYEDATVDHVADGRLLWEDEANPGTSYLSLDFTDSLDSAGAAWADSALSLTFKPRMTGLHILEQFVRLGYEWRVVPDSVPDGTYLLQIYNAGTLGAVQPVAIQGGAYDIRHDARYSRPGQSSVMVQAAQNVYAHADSSTLESAFGRIEGSLLDQNLTSEAEAAQAAQDGIDQTNLGAESLVYTIRPLGGFQPLIAFRPGDEIEIVDPPRIDDVRRVAQIVLAWDNTGPEYTISLGSVALAGQAAVNQTVDDIIKAFRRAQFEADPAAAFTPGGGSGQFTVTVAGLNYPPQIEREKADLLWDDNDFTPATGAAVWAQIETLLGTDPAFSGGLVVFGTGGLVGIPSVITFQANTVMSGNGIATTSLGYNSAVDLVWTFDGGGIRDITLLTVGF